MRRKRVYDPVADDDGLRVLVDRLWPRGVTAESARIDVWIKDIAPTDALRKWFAHGPRKWEEFRRRYLRELNTPVKKKLLEEFVQKACSGIVTLVYAAKDREHNNAVVLKSLINYMSES